MRDRNKVELLYRLGNVRTSHNGINRNVYACNGVAPTLVAAMGLGGGVCTIHNREEMRTREIRLGNIWGATGGSFAGMVYDQQALSPSITTMGGGGQTASCYMRCA